MRRPTQGALAADPDLPFTITKATSFDLPWRIASLPDGRMLVIGKVRRVNLVTPQGEKTRLEGVPPNWFQGRSGFGPSGFFPASPPRASRR